MSPEAEALIARVEFAADEADHDASLEATVNECLIDEDRVMASLRTKDIRALLSALRTAEERARRAAAEERREILTIMARAEIRYENLSFTAKKNDERTAYRAMARAIEYERHIILARARATTNEKDETR